MNFITAKKHQIENAIPGLKIETQYADTSLFELAIYDGAGNLIVVRSPYSNLQVLVKAPPKMVEKFRLFGTYRGLKVEEVFDSQYEAEDRQNEITGFSSDHNLGIESIQVEDLLAG